MVLTGLTLTARPPFSLDAVVHSHGWAALAPFRHRSNPLRLSYVDRLPTDRVVALTVLEAPGGVRVQVESPDGPLTGNEETEVARRVGWMLGLDQDFAPFYALARTEPKLAQVEKQAQGRLLRCPTLWEDTVKTILTTNTSWSGTIRMVGALVERFGHPMPGRPDRRAFPSPEQLAQVGPETLRKEAGLGYRAPYVAQLARSLAAGQLDLEALTASDLSTEELRRRLLAIRGVGGYAAANLLMILGHYSHLPVDSWARKMVSQEWHDGQAVGQAEVEAAFRAWGPWKGLAYWFWAWSE